MSSALERMKKQLEERKLKEAQANGQSAKDSGTGTAAEVTSVEQVQPDVQHTTAQGTEVAATAPQSNQAEAERRQQVQAAVLPEVSSAPARPSENGSANNHSGQHEEVSGTPAAETTSSNHPLKMEMAELQAQLEQNVPGFANKLREIHTKLRQDPAIVTLLTDDEIGVIVAGLEKHTNVQIVAPAAIKASKSRSKEPVSASDL